MSDIISTEYEVHILTNRYAGNFERPMGSYVTGITDMTEYDPRLAKLGQTELIALGIDPEFFWNIHSYGTDDIEHGPNMFKCDGNNVIMHFSEPLDSKILDLIFERAKNFYVTFQKYEREEHDRMFPKVSPLPKRHYDSLSSYREHSMIVGLEIIGLKQYKIETVRTVLDTL